MHTDCNVPFPFTDGSIERILCHLSLSFTPSPLHCLRQMLRVLHPEGTVVVTSFNRTPTSRCSFAATGAQQIMMNSVLRPRSPFTISAVCREAARQGLLQTMTGVSQPVCRLMPARVQSGFYPSSTTDFCSRLYGRPNPLDETAPRVYTSHLVMIRIPISTTTSYAGT